jgi:hypothetical protein
MQKQGRGREHSWHQATARLRLIQRHLPTAHAIGLTMPSSTDERNSTGEALDVPSLCEDCSR